MNNETLQRAIEIHVAWAANRLTPSNRDKLAAVKIMEAIKAATEQNAR